MTAARHDQVTSIGDAIRLAMEAQRSEIHVAMPGEVIEYSGATQTATIRPGHLRAVPLDDGTYQAEQLPDLYDVPILFPRAGTYSITFPVSAGDTVLLLFPHEDIGRWRELGETCDPGDRRLHHIAGAVAILGLYPTGEISAAPTDRIRIAHGGIVTDFRSTHVAIAGDNYNAARADLVRTELGKIQTAITALGGSYTAPVTAGAIASAYIKTGG